MTASSLPYEHRALESVFVSVVSALELELATNQELVNNLLVQFEDQIDRDNLKSLLQYNRKLSAFKNRSKLIHEAIEELLSSGS